MQPANSQKAEGYRHTRLSEIDPEWALIAHKQRDADIMAGKALSLPIREFRALGYRPPALPEDAPVPDIDIIIGVEQISVKDGTKIGIRIYRPVLQPKNALLFFNVHGGGSASTTFLTSKILTLWQVGCLAAQKPKKDRTGS
jgi:hypothetical protein